MSDVYKIGVQLALSGNMEAGLIAIAGRLTGLNAQTESLMKKWDTLGSNMKLALGGAVATGAGLGILDVMKNLVEKGADFVHVQQQVLAATQSQKDLADATANAWKEASKYGLNVSTVLSDIKEARMVFGSTEHAMDFIEPLERMRVVLNAMGDGRGDATRDAVYLMARAGELKGLQKPEDFVDYFDKMTQAITASGGKVGPSDFMQATQYGKISSKGWSEEFYTRYFPSMIQEMRPTTAGQSIMSLYNTLVGGHMSIPAISAASGLGLLDDPSKIVYSKQGNAKGVLPGGIKGSDELTANPFFWAQDVLRPLVEKKIGHQIQGADDPDALKVLMSVFGNRNSAAAIATLMDESTRINKDAGLIGQAKGLSAADDLLKNDPVTAFNNFSNSWKNLMTSMGAPQVQTAINAMNSLANVFKSITAVAAANPDIVKHLGTDAVVGGTALTAGGVIAMGVAITNFMSGKGGLMGSATALTGAAGALTNAAVALGGRGVVAGGGGAVAGGGGGGLGILGRLIIAAPLIGEAWQQFTEGADRYNREHPHGDAPSVFGRGGGALGGRGRARDPFAPGQPGVDPSFVPPGNRPGFWYDPSKMHLDLGITGKGGSQAPAPVVNVSPPQTSVQTTVTIDGNSIKAFIQTTIKSAISALGGMPTGAPTNNTGTMPTTVDGGASGN